MENNDTFLVSVLGFTGDGTLIIKLYPYPVVN